MLAKFYNKLLLNPNMRHKKCVMGLSKSVWFYFFEWMILKNKMKQGNWILKIFFLYLYNKISLTFQPRFSKKVHKRACPVVFPPHGPENKEFGY